jgi:hypothetical protein
MQKKISKEKEDLRKVVEEINSYSELCNVEKIYVEDINEGIFPWSQISTTFHSTLFTVINIVFVVIIPQ